MFAHSLFVDFSWELCGRIVSFVIKYAYMTFLSPYSLDSRLENNIGVTINNFYKLTVCYSGLEYGHQTAQANQPAQSEQHRFFFFQK